jgi:hypothetical protein
MPIAAWRYVTVVVEGKEGRRQLLFVIAVHFIGWEERGSERLHAS